MTQTNEQDEKKVILKERIDGSTSSNISSPRTPAT